ncbi:NMDA receptor synaptonuclear signaling and neuronal migration factor-like [Dreissena polymorpha]|uniref:NMDA receptor synaptonuclear signaling and neuronal migration factor n=1 Tax=Dreissena polymorpha TaxID=45954 RepID=A0A9D4FJ55_DREPO|nr:NMDA receptor synaptonuclear signaling and neuronal migration factor-like [Dreissena polymorpha]KAH3796757.1 hypothetical protein DPMN_150328 [Dreissena polymorpha]
MEPRRRELWENPPTPATRDAYLAWNYGENLRQPEHEFQVELDQKKFRAAQHVEQMHTGDNFRPPRVVLISSKIPKCHLLTKIYKDDVIPVLYDFDSNSFTELLDAITRRLDEFKKNCKARSIMVLCQGGPGYIYLLRNYAVTPQKLHKPSYRPVVGFWRAMAGLISKLSPLESAIHIFGFNLVGNEQGKQLVLMLQSLMYPNLVRVEPVTEETDEGRDIVNQYLNYGRYKILSKDANTTKEVDFQKEGIGQVKRFHGPPMLRVAR